MADIELVIKIPEEEYNLIKMKSESNIGGVSSEAERIIANGVLLPKGHGRLIDADEIAGDGSWDFADRLDETPTIIEADKAESEDKV